ncbi:MAG: hypothetical protein WAW96_15525 [Alphaproteobacteria bacterium]
MNALKHGAYCAPARALARELSLLLADVSFALKSSEKFAKTGIDLRKTRKRMAAIDLSEQAFIRLHEEMKYTFKRQRQRVIREDFAGQSLPEISDGMKD